VYPRGGTQRAHHYIITRLQPTGNNYPPPQNSADKRASFRVMESAQDLPQKKQFVSVARLPKQPPPLDNEAQSTGKPALTASRPPLTSHPVRRSNDHHRFRHWLVVCRPLACSPAHPRSWATRPARQMPGQKQAEILRRQAFSMDSGCASVTEAGNICSLQSPEHSIRKWLSASPLHTALCPQPFLTSRSTDLGRCRFPSPDGSD